MSDEKRSERVIIWLTALGVLVGLAAAFIDAIGVLDRDRPAKGADAVQESLPESTPDQEFAVNDSAPGLDFGPRTGLGVAPLSAEAISVPFDTGLEGMPLVHTPPRSGDWRRALCTGDVVIEINGAPALEGAAALEGQLLSATAALVRPRANLALAPGPDSSVRVHPGGERDC